MRILLSNKFYYPKGGDCIHTLALERLLKERGHEIAVFSLSHPFNIPSEFSSYFPSEIDYSKKNFNNFFEQFSRPLFSFEVKKKFNALLDDFKPDIVHLQNIHSYLSPLIAKEAYKRNIPVIWTLHDFKLLCPRYDCRRDGKPCELCFRKKINVVRYKCMKGWLFASILGYLEALIWNRNNLSRYINKFICPSDFIRQKMISGGFRREQLITINNFFDGNTNTVFQPVRGNYYCYVGRLSSEKGVETLLRAAKELPQYHLKVIGTGPLSEYFVNTYTTKHIEFLGHRPSNEVHELLSRAVFTVIPSEWYENSPLSVIESLSIGIPVLGANIGGIPELIESGMNGLLFEPGNIQDLKNKIESLWQNSVEFSSSKIAARARTRFSSNTYYDELICVYNKTLSG